MFRFVFSHFTQNQSLAKWRVAYTLSKRKSSQIKMAKPLKKMLEKGSKKKWHKSPVMPMMPGQQVKKGVTDGQRRRSEQVSKVLYSYITSIVNSGELSPKIADLAVDIVKVKVVPDFSALNVYWLSSGADTDEQLEILLKQHEAKLRQILISYHILGNIPYVNFVRDDSVAKYLEIEKILKTADFGPDFEPAPANTSIRPGSLQTSHNEDDDLLKQFEKMSLNFLNPSQYKNLSVMDERTGSLISDDQELEHPSDSDSDVSEDKYRQDPDLNFRSDIYGLPHSEIMQRLLVKKHKTKYRTSAVDSDGRDETVQKSTPADYEKFVKKLKMTKRRTGKYNQYTIVDHMKEEGDSWHVFQHGNNEKTDTDKDDDFDDEDNVDR